ncbi:hypothetical protein C8F01DRAFT_1152433 [Mycena amicta]|nr:hypothetical protein C8F01DRAFT_1152433 [Mycena amicta]
MTTVELHDDDSRANTHEVHEDNTHEVPTLKARAASCVCPKPLYAHHKCKVNVTTLKLTPPLQRIKPQPTQEKILKATTTLSTSRWPQPRMWKLVERVWGPGLSATAHRYLRPTHAFVNSRQTFRPTTATMAPTAPTHTTNDRGQRWFWRRQCHPGWDLIVVAGAMMTTHNPFIA